MTEKGGVRFHVGPVVGPVSRRIDRVIEVSELVTEGAVHEGVEAAAEHEGPAAPGPRILMCAVPRQVALVSGLERRILPGLRQDDDDPGVTSGR